MNTVYVILGVVLLLALYDVFNRKHTIKSNFPLVGRLRYFLEKIGPELRQYWVAHNREEQPFDRTWRSYIYASAKKQNNLIGFGSDMDFNKNGHFFIKTSAFPTNIKNTVHKLTPETLPCAKTIGKRRKHPYRPQSVINISAMSYGSLGKRATEANNRGAWVASAYHNTGEGGFAPKYHNKGADVVFHIGTGYFGCGYTDKEGQRQFDIEQLVNLTKKYPNIIMIELKLSQGAKPGKGGILPGKKVTKEIAAIRGIEQGKGVKSPAYHSAFSNVDEMIYLLEEIAEKTGLPVGIKSAVGKLDFWNELAEKVKKGVGPDFIAIDGGEGGTGAAPAAFADNMSLPLDDAFTSVYKIFQLRGAMDDVVWIASGKLGHPTKAAKAFAMGADLINIAREVMISAGCIQAQVCHTGNCPAGIATHKWWLEKGVNVTEKSGRVGNFLNTLKKDLLQVTHASGYEHPCEFAVDDVVINTSDITMRKTFGEVYDYKKTPVKYEHQLTKELTPS